MTESGEVQYLVLPDAEDPLLFARVRWPDIAQAVSLGRPEWLHDPGLFDLPYHPSGTRVTLAHANVIAAEWGAPPPAETAGASSVPSLIRRMPSNWSELAPAERRAWSLHIMGGERRADGGGIRRGGVLRSLRRSLRHSEPAAAEPSPLVPAGPPSNGGDPVSVDPSVPAVVTNGARMALDRNGHHRPHVTEHRQHARARVYGRGQIRCGYRTMVAELADVGLGGLQCIVLDDASAVVVGGRLEVMFELAVGDPSTQARLEVGGRVSWLGGDALGTKVGVSFGDQDAEHIDRVRELLVAHGRGPGI